MESLSEFIAMIKEFLEKVIAYVKELLAGLFGEEESAAE